MKYILSFLFCTLQFYLRATDDITKSVVANKHVTHAIEKRSFLHLYDCKIDSISFYFFNKIKQQKIKSYSYSEKTNDFKIDTKWIRNFFDEKTDTIVTDTSIIYENNKIFSIDNPNNLFIKQTIFFDEKQNILKSNVNYLAIPVNHYDPYNENDSKSLFPIIYFSINHNEKYKKPKDKKIGVFSTDIFMNEDSSNTIKNYYNSNFIDFLFEKVNKNKLTAIDIDSGIIRKPAYFENKWKYHCIVDSIIADSITAIYLKSEKMPVSEMINSSNWQKIRLVQELFLSNKNIVSTRIIGVIFYFEYKGWKYKPMYYPSFYIKFNESKDKNFKITKYK